MDLKYEKKDVYSLLDASTCKEVDKYSKKYIDFLNVAKTERICVEEFLELLSKNGFEDITKKKNLKKGDKIYFVNKQRALFIAVIGEKDLSNGINMIGAHIDSPRLDLKPMPLFEKYGLGFLKTAYYGGIKEYQWLSIPLAMYGVIYTSDGKKVNISIGDKISDPCFTIADLLPHLAREQMKKNANDFIDPEKLNILFGSTKGKEKTVKENILKILNKKYGIKEIDFARSDIEFVPAFNAKFVGIDEGLIGGYGQDDRVCAYATVNAIINASNNKISNTAIAIIVDKEEIGSLGNSSMKSEAFDLFINMILEKTNSKVDKLQIYHNSKMLSADVTAGLNPMYEEVHDAQNASIIGSGVSVEKYGGSAGKGGASEASAEFMSYVMSLLEQEKVVYQLGTLGKIGRGGGGTIAYILANKSVDVVDCGTPVLAMHSPFEITSKYDVYMTYKAYCVFYK